MGKTVEGLDTLRYQAQRSATETMAGSRLETQSASYSSAGLLPCVPAANLTVATLPMEMARILNTNDPKMACGPSKCQPSKPCSGLRVRH